MESGLACLPPQSPYEQLIGDVLGWHEQYPEDWIRVWNLVEEEWNRREPCPEGAANAFNIDAKLNGADIALGMLYGEGDFGKTMTISHSLRAGLGLQPRKRRRDSRSGSGLEGIPDTYKSGIEEIADEKFSYTDYSFRTIVDSTEKPRRRHGRTTWRAN